MIGMVLLVLPGAGAAQAEPVTIRDDFGGNVLAYQARLGRYYRAGVKRLFLKKWRFPGGAKDLNLIDGRQLHKLDPDIRVCGLRRRPRP